jgi:hypothetical protein
MVITTQDYPRDQSSNAFRQALADWGTLISNVVIAAFTIVLACIARNQTRIANRQRRLAAEAIATNKAIERAYIALSSHPPGLNIPGLTYTGKDGNAVRNVEVYVSIKNYGNTPANVTYVLVQVLDRSEPLPEHPPYDESGLKPVSVSTVKGDDFTFFHSRSIDFGDIEDIRNGTSPKKLYVIGYADYIDKFGGRHRAGFGRWYNPTPDDVRLYQDESGTVDIKSFNERNNLLFITEPNYNYDRKRKKGEGKDWENQP